MSDEIEWSRIRDGVDLIRCLLFSRSLYLEKKRKKKEKSYDGFLVPGDYPYISTNKMLDVCILLSTYKRS